MVTLTIDGKQVQAEEGAMLRTVALDNNIDIPGLCDHDGVTPYGACRLCMVEIKTARGRERFVASCLYPVEEGLLVSTATERVLRNRRMLVELLLARCPDSEVLQKMAAELGVEGGFAPEEGNGDCILCALCTRACREVVGVSAISLANRGVERVMSTPFGHDLSDDCIGCGSCSYVCPTGAISMEDAGGVRTIRWPHQEMQFPLRKCTVCGSHWIPEKQIAYIAKLSGTELSEYEACPDCR